LHDDTELPIEEIAAEVLTPEQEEYERELNLPDSEDSSDEEETKTREKWKGGYLQVFTDKSLCDANPPLREDGSPALSEENKPIFKVFVVKYRAYLKADDTDPDNLSIVYVWARNTQESINIVASAVFEFHSQQFGAKRGRRKLFKPDENMVKMLTMFINTKNQAAVDSLLDSYPDYRYVVDGTTPPEFATTKAIAVVRK
jgi:hypothetical protein